MGILKEKRYLGMVGNVLTLIGVFLPFVSITVSLFGVSAGGATLSLIAGAPFYGILVLVASIFSLLVIFSDKLVAKVPFFEKLQNQKLALIAAIVSAVAVLINALSLPGSTGGLGTISLGFGFWVMVVGVVASVAYPIIYKGENN